MNSAEKENCKQINEILRKFRIMNGFTQKQVADYLQIDRSTYVKYETSRVPEIDVLMLICELYHIDIGELLLEFHPVRPGGEISPLAVLRSPPAEKRMLSDNEERLLAIFRRCLRKSLVLEFALKILHEDEDATAELLNT